MGHLTNPGTYLISQFPHVPSDALYVRLHGNKHTTILDTNLISQTHVLSDATFSEIKSNLTNLPILKEPTVKYEIYLPPINYTYPITIHDDDKYGLLCVKQIHVSTAIGQQLPIQALKVVSTIKILEQFRNFS